MYYENVFVVGGDRGEVDGQWYTVWSEPMGMENRGTLGQTGFG